MAYFEGSYKQLLFGVSQQARKDRLDGQVEEQVNMTSDLTFGLRRRSAAQLSFLGPSTVTDWNRLSFTYTEVGGRRVLIVIDTATGLLTARSTIGDVLYTQQNDYLVATTRSSISFAVVQDALYIANIEKTPYEVAATTGYPDPKYRGFFFVNAGAYNKRYYITIGVPGADWTVDVESAGTANPARAQPEYIAGELVTALAAHADVGTAAGFAYLQVGAYVYITAPVAISVSSGSGTAYVRTSGASNVPLVSDLPATLPPEADGYIVGVGTGKVKVYYRWVQAEKAWVEDAEWSALYVPEQMPLRLSFSDPVWSLETPEYERRAAGNETTNPALQFLERPLSGITSFQGRLVLLAGDFVCMSASNKPERWYRSTMAQLEADDPIEIAASSTLATPYRHGVQFNQDLVLFSEQYQATVPGRAALTPASATLSISSTYTNDPSVRPVPVGMSMYFAAPRAAGWAGMWEMTPSPYNENQLSAQDVTGHIPQYIRGPVRFIAASSTTNIVVVGDSKDAREVVIHEYLWTGTEKVHQSWHRWRFEHPVLFAYFDGDVVYLVCQAPGNRWMHIRVDIRQGAGDAGLTAGRLDYYWENVVGSAGDGYLLVPSPVPQLWAKSEDPATLMEFQPWAFHLDGVYVGVRELLVPVEVVPNVGVRYRVTAPVGVRIRAGVKYTSLVTPSAPVVRDQNDVPITTQRASLHKFVVNLQNTGEFTYQTRDHYRALDPVVTSPLRFGSPELTAGAPQVADGTVYIPCRLDMQTTLLTLSTDDVYDLNVTSLEYGFKYHQRYGRRQ